MHAEPNGPSSDPLLDPVDDDRTLWDQAAGGNRAAFAELFNRHVEALWNYAYRLTGSWQLAEDVTSSTFLTAWRRLGDQPLTHSSARPWLYTVAANLARNEFRWRRRFSRVLTRVPRTDIVRDHADEVATQVDAGRRLQVVLSAVAALPKAEREAVELCLIGGLSTAEVAEMHGVAEVSIRSRISRARTKLRTVLSQAGIDNAVLLGEEA